MIIFREIAVHDTGGLLNDSYFSSQHFTAWDVNERHRQRWNFISTLGFYGGYNFFISADGKTTQFRAIGEETAAQKGRNWDVISICLAGNFSLGVDKPTLLQQSSLKNLITMLIWKNLQSYKITDAELDLSPERVFPHRHFNSTECYGSDLKDSWAKDLLRDAPLPIAESQESVLRSLYLALRDKLLLLLNLLKKQQVQGVSLPCADQAR